jgi:hypothetical protein
LGRCGRSSAVYEPLIIHILRLNAHEWPSGVVVQTFLKGKVLTGEARTTAAEFSEHTKSKTFIKTALQGAPRCAICDGYLDPEKSLSYDHKLRKRDGGRGDESNLQLCHPYCNQSIKG